MPISRLLKDAAFEAEHCRAMALAFEEVLTDLGLVDRADPLCELVAIKIVGLARQGVDDPQRLRELALAAITKPSKTSSS